MLDENVDRIWRDHDFHRIVNGHDPRHAGRLAGVGGIAALGTRIPGRGNERDDERERTDHSAMKHGGSPAVTSLPC